MRTILFAFFIALFSRASAQELNLSYYLPDVEYDKNIPTPKDFMGHELGEWHATHDQVYYYAQQLARVSDRVSIIEYARSHENRPLIYLIITSPENHRNLENIRTEHLKLTKSSESNSVNIDNMPVIVNIGSSVHGNEPSGVNGAIAFMYYLAAAKTGEINDFLNNAIIMLDPALNPDGVQRFSTWANMHKGKNLISDPLSREFNEAWPGSRTNHYWFDLNRDWLLLVHPESRGRIKAFHEWRPDVLTDHHEMGTNSTYFFQPGIPSRTNPNTPKLNQELTAKIGEYHAAALDALGSLYYSKESFDDYYYGKGSTYPDAHGCVGILFEQASSRGHLQDSDNGPLSFPFTIRNQVATMFSTMRASVALRKDLLNYKKNSIIEGRTLAKQNPVKAYAFGEPHDPYRVARFIDILLTHQIEVHKLKRDVGGISRDGGYVVSLDQDQYRLAKSIFEKVTTFEDSLFYDVSAWTMPLAMDIPYAEVRSAVGDFVGERVTTTPEVKGKLIGDANTYAYLVEWDQYTAPRLLRQLLDHGVNVKQSNRSFTLPTAVGNKTFAHGTLIIHTGNNQIKPGGGMHNLISRLVSENQLLAYAVNTGLALDGVDLGSRTLSTIKQAKPLMVIGMGVSSYDAGEMWHYLDHTLDYAVPMISTEQFSRVDLSEYTTLILPNGNYATLNSASDKIKSWVQSGGNIIAAQGAVSWLKSREILSYDVKPVNNTNPIGDAMGSYADGEKIRGSRVTGGMIAMMDIDNTHPLFYGYKRSQLPIFKSGNMFIKPSLMPYSCPARYTESPVLGGYIHRDNAAALSGSASVFVQRVGSGKVVALVDNPVFRGYWWGANKVLANALFLTPNIN